MAGGCSNFVVDSLASCCCCVQRGHLLCRFVPDRFLSLISDMIGIVDVDSALSECWTGVGVVSPKSSFADFMRDGVQEQRLLERLMLAHVIFTFYQTS